ncbi:MAG: hypothetical protein P8L18_16775 [Verrucomicrobiota bacterium]|nr:hypothetical protein [Verrucomicrobiota bacterium]
MKKSFFTGRLGMFCKLAWVTFAVGWYQEANARSFRVAMIPNGNVNRCANCHMRSSGGGPRTAFGEAVRSITGSSRAPFWSETLAALDSDGDGATNGLELGDPDGDGIAIQGAQVTHPGDVNDFPIPPQPALAITLSATTPAQLTDGRLVDDTILFSVDDNNLDNWEPFSSVIGNRVFVIEANTFAEDDTFANQNYAVAFQPVGGGTMATTAAFFTDDGLPYVGPINGSRQNGNPGRVAGDRRPGASTYVVWGEASPHLYDAFQSDDRWNLGFDRLANGRYGATQAFSLETTNLVPTPLSPALDAINGREDSGFAAGSQIGRFGGDVAVLDDGNILVVVDDRSQIRESSSSTTAVILAPDGSVVKESWVVDARDIWSNVTSYLGGFAIRVHETIYFHDNQGNETGSVSLLEDLPIDISSDTATFSTSRGDATRITGHINSPYIFLAGSMGLLAEDGLPAEDENFEPIQVVRLAAFDTRKTGAESFAGSTTVNELGSETGGTDTTHFLPDLGRVNLASDALNRVTVAYEGVLRDEFGDKLGLPQTFVRVMSYESETGFGAITPSFFAFVNQNDVDIRTFRPTVAMTTTEILVGAKGEISSENRPELGPDTPTQTTFYTVFSHPVPMDDPTPAVPSSLPTSVAISANGGQVSIVWEGTTLESASSVLGPWTPIQGAAKPYTVQTDQGQSYFRAK